MHILYGQTVQTVVGVHVLHAHKWYRRIPNISIEENFSSAVKLVEYLLKKKTQKYKEYKILAKSNLYISIYMYEYI